MQRFRGHSDEAEPGEEARSTFGAEAEVEGLREHVESVLKVVFQTATKIEREARTEAEMILAAAEREAGSRLEQANRDAAELREQAKWELAEAKADGAEIRRSAETAYEGGLAELQARAARQERGLKEQLELIQDALMRLVDDFGEVVEKPEKLVNSAEAIEHEETLMPADALRVRMQILRLYSDRQLSIKAIAKQLRTPRTYVRRVLLEAGLREIDEPTRETVTASS